ncbi:DNA-methyltransferase [Niallia circulans]|uniref:DNA-methyltransferase n=1 Tax=Niallia circulans TaxID=1397 RepID=UPI0015607593|nr:site-specific DNA-methyltransferase [Niallia circulans]NRG30717.1 site-specific DNA-methyltransferase [Niallia circulans]
MRMLPDNSVDLILTDPPYNVSMKSNFHTMGRKGVDFGEWDKEFDQESWLEIACDKVRKGGSAVVFNDYKNIGTMTEILTKRGFVVKEMLIWRKSNPMPRNRDRLYVTSIEVALWAVKGKGWVFNRQRETYENAIFESPIVNHTKRLHPTQKPQEIIEELLRIHSNENDIVLDCFMGSGTTAVAAVRTNRKFIGFETEPSYVEIANKRLDNEMEAEA